MKNILITGKNSYIGTSIKGWLEKYGYFVKEISVHGTDWELESFKEMDVVIHVAGIAHQKETRKNRNLYYEVNTVLALKVFNKALQEGVKQFIFLSSGAVFTQSDKNNRKIIITETSEYCPKTAYGKSKREAEIGMMKILSGIPKETRCKLAIVRPPMIYGPGAKGNYTSLAKLAKKSPIFPYYYNMRSMLFIDNLCECVRLIIFNNDQGFFYPQDEEYICTSEMVKEIGACHGKKVRLFKGMEPFIFMAGMYFNIINKVFGIYIYDKHISQHYNGKYRVSSFVESIKKTEEFGEIGLK